MLLLAGLLLHVPIRDVECGEGVDYDSWSKSEFELALNDSTPLHLKAEARRRKVGLLLCFEYQL